MLMEELENNEEEYLLPVNPVDTDEGLEGEVVSDELQLSVNAISGTMTGSTIRVAGKMRLTPVD